LFRVEHERGDIASSKGVVPSSDLIKESWVRDLRLVEPVEEGEIENRATEKAETTELIPGVGKEKRNAGSPIVYS
jgi:hypothetical protein